MPMSTKEKRFVMALSQCADAALAAKEAGYKDVIGTRTARRILAKPEAISLLQTLCVERANQNFESTQRAPADGAAGGFAKATAPGNTKRTKKRVTQRGAVSAGERPSTQAFGDPSKVSLASLTEELEEARCRAVDAGQSSAAIAATMGKAKLHGLDHPKSKPQSRKSPEKIERVIVDPENSDG